MTQYHHCTTNEEGGALVRLNVTAGLQTQEHILINLDVLEFPHVIVMSIEIGSIAAVVPPTSSVGYRTVLITSVIIIL